MIRFVVVFSFLPRRKKSAKRSTAMTFCLECSICWELRISVLWKRDVTTLHPRTTNRYLTQNIYGLLSKGEVKMAGYWPRSVFCMFMDAQKLNVFMDTQKNNQANIQQSWSNKLWSIKDLLYGIQHQNMINFLCGKKPLSRAGMIAPFCPLGWSIMARSFIYGVFV